MTSRPRARAICTLALLCLFCLGVTAEAWARVGGGRSMGSRSYSRPSAPAQKPSQQQTSNNQQQARPAAPQPAAPGGFMRGLAGGLLGGFLGSMLFSGVAGATGKDGAGGASSGPGLLDILLIGLLLYLAYRFFMKRRRQAAQADGNSYYQSQNVETGTFGGDMNPPPPPPPQTGYAGDGGDLERGLAHIRSMEPNFDEGFFQDRAMDVFFQLQAAHGQRDLSGVRDLLSDEMAGELQRDIKLLETQGRINRLENIAVRSVDLVQAWQEMGQDYLVVRFLANLLDYVVDEKTGAIVEGSNSQPVKFEEYWTFTRPVGPGPWRLCAITQPS